MVKTSSITSLILGSIALVQCIPLDVRDPSPPPTPSFEECLNTEFDKGNDLINSARECLSEISKITCPETVLSTPEELADFGNCLFDNKSSIDDQFKRARDCIEKVKGEACTDLQPPQ